jgi:hypothetical protein
MMRSMVIGTVALVLAGAVGAGARVSNQQTDRIRESASGAINPGKRINDKHNPRDGFIVVDEDTRLGYIKSSTIWRPFDLTGADLSEGPKACKTSIRNIMGNGSGLDHPIIHQAGLKLLADSLQRLIANDEDVLAIFLASKIEQYDDHGTKHTAREWADLFKKRALSIIDSRCEP